MIFERLYWKIRYGIEDRYFRKRCTSLSPGIYYDKKHHRYFTPSVMGETGSVEYVAGELVRSGLVFHYSLQGTLNHAHTFDEVLLAAYNRAASFGIPDEVRGEYSQQELQFIEALVDRGVRDRTSE